MEATTTKKCKQNKQVSQLNNNNDENNNKTINQKWKS